MAFSPLYNSHNCDFFVDSAAFVLSYFFILFFPLPNS